MLLIATIVLAGCGGSADKPLAGKPAPAERGSTPKKAQASDAPAPAPKTRLTQKRAAAIWKREVVGGKAPWQWDEPHLLAHTCTASKARPGNHFCVSRIPGPKRPPRETVVCGFVTGRGTVDEFQETNIEHASGCVDQGFPVPV